ncbi:MAG: hypothetical protein EOO01_03500 [Chitinophagaceae bacterium]|nr:MAG: hypothetical protein EOO01_03500 [Chitinophagaceae bacterium]
MVNENFLEKLASGLGQTAAIKNVMGEPIHLHEKTIIPVARVAYGFGGGYGEGRRKQGSHQSLQDIPGEQGPMGEGAGGGGGVHASVKGVFEITPNSSRFIPANPGRHVLLGIAIGFLLRSIFFKRAKR